MKVSHFSQYPSANWRWPNFAPRELASKREGELLIDPASMDKLQTLRDDLARPMVITSAYRSPAHNRAVGGATGSLHLQGKAFDVVLGNHDPHPFIAAARKAGFTGIGTYLKQGFIHINTGRVRTWGYPFPKPATGLALEPVKVRPPVVDRTPATPAPAPTAPAVTGQTKGAIYILVALAAAGLAFLGVK